MTTRSCRIQQVTKVKIVRLYQVGLPRWAIMERFGLSQNDLIPILKKIKGGKKDERVL